MDTFQKSFHLTNLPEAEMKIKTSLLQNYVSKVTNTVQTNREYDQQPPNSYFLSEISIEDFLK